MVADLATHNIPAAAFDVVMMFNYLDRERLPDLLAAVKPGGWFLAETFLVTQPQHGWGPTSANHLLAFGELATLVASFDIVLTREATEIADGRPMDVASVLAQRPTN